MKLYLITLLIVSSVAQAKVYKWIDEDGVTHYSQIDPENGAKEIKVKGMPSDESKHSIQYNVSSAELNCEQVINHGLKLMKAKFSSSGKSNPMAAMVNDPNFVADGVAECNREKNDPVKAAQWLCQQNANSFDEVLACEK